jgi:hypothetical protein
MIQLTPGGDPEKHIMTSDKNIEVANISEDGQIIKFTVESTAVITHDEHDKIVLEKGTYYKTNQMEFNPFTNTVSYIFD